MPKSTLPPELLKLLSQPEDADDTAVQAAIQALLTDRDNASKGLAAIASERDAAKAEAAGHLQQADNLRDRVDELKASLQKAGEEIDELLSEAGESEQIAALRAERDKYAARLGALSPEEMIALDPYTGPLLLTVAEHAKLPPHHQAIFSDKQGTVMANPLPAVAPAS